MKKVENGSPALDAVLARLRAAHRRDPLPSLGTRRRWLERLETLVRRHRNDICEAIRRDFGHRSIHDSMMGDVWVTVNHIRYVRRRLRRWMRPRGARANWVFLPGRAQVVPQPKGVVGIISPWNYPVMLALVPLAGALAAGNRVLLKLSEHTPETSALLADLLSEVFEETEVAPVTGGPDLGRAVTRLPLDHLLFTGGNAVGRKVALAAAENLVPVTLELGGKCPVLYNASWPVESFADRVAQGKCFTAGQSCVAPDYLLIPEGQERAVVSALTQAVARRYPTLIDNPDYSGVASPARLSRLIALVEEAVEKGAEKIEINPAGERLDGDRKMPLTLLLDTPEEAQVMREEIFGPVLPIVTYRTLDDALDYINDRPAPLALYVFDRDRARVRRVLHETRAGGVTVNDTLLHFICDDLPRFAFGNSGHGGYYGKASFDTFTHYKSLFYQGRFAATGLFAPPYGRLIERLLRFLIGG